MTKAMTRHLVIAGFLAGALSGVVAAQPSSPTLLGTIQIGRSVMANGQRLPAGSYQVRLSGDAATPVVDQQGETWVDFVRGGKVVGRELAIVVNDADIKSVAKGARLPAGESRVEMLKEGRYWRVWLHKRPNHYLIYLPPTP
jgi:hypothetical protein